MENSETEPKANDTLWIIANDDTIQIPTIWQDRYNWYKIEIRSPALMNSYDNMLEVKSICMVMSHTYRMNCNQSCGLHVHISNGLNDFSVEILRNLMAIIWTFEKQFEDIHPKHRILNNNYAYSLHEYANINGNFGLGENKSTSDRDWKENRILYRQQHGLPEVQTPAKSRREALQNIIDARSRKE